MTFADDVRQRRKDLSLTQVEAADLAGVSERFVRLVEAGKVSVRLDKLEALLEVLGLELRASLRRT
ncbi:type II toxin-antitoxin system Y4mF family antitoxin [Raineyella sp. LH-20]|uniref:type II toxin-antitoxin system Y4mF family antitoxin n=1 Tax=Raineyella sp. LH-20 TaxID=3081204 RepID=UPI0029548215|nr:type II toxin-antitoxin system Y4mF family antitoxin [Raineyella sp. LH-20]WOP19511.1 type II toxin-antitoxin system Y4mF family antitoxin [Raineyella sp. LH-20]